MIHRTYATLTSHLRRSAHVLAALGLAAAAFAAPALPVPLPPALQPLAAATAHASVLEAPSAAVLGMEGRMVQLVNADRANHGLAPLEFDPTLATIARWRSEDMAARNYFSHDIGGYMVFQVLKDWGVTYRVAGENLAWNTYPAAETVARAQTALMNSPSHRENILRPDYTHVGIGAAIGPDGKFLYTQIFRTAR